MGVGHEFGTAPVVLSVVPIFMVAQADTVLGLTGGTAELLAEAIFSSVKNYAILFMIKPVSQIRRSEGNLLGFFAMRSFSGITVSSS